MSLNLRFAIASDLHITLPQTIRNLPNRFHLVEYSISVLDVVLAHLEQLDLDFLLLPGDLTQDGEPENHQWLRSRLQSLSFPVYVVPGNHDVLSPSRTERSIGASEFPHYYREFGYCDPKRLYYTCELAPGLRLIALNSNQFAADGKQLGQIDSEQLYWLKNVLNASDREEIFVMVHHNVIEHLPDQAEHPLGRRYMLDNAVELRAILQTAGVKVIFTGHLHVQDIARDCQLYEITTGSLVSYPHPYRYVEFRMDDSGDLQLDVQSFRVEQVVERTNLTEFSRAWIDDRSYPFMQKLVQCSGLELSETEVDAIARDLRHFWADISAGDAIFDFQHFPAAAQRYFESFGALDAAGEPALIDNQATLKLGAAELSHEQHEG